MARIWPFFETAYDQIWPFLFFRTWQPCEITLLLPKSKYHCSKKILQMQLQTTKKDCKATMYPDHFFPFSNFKPFFVGNIQRSIFWEKVKQVLFIKKCGPKGLKNCPFLFLPIVILFILFRWCLFLSLK